MNESLESLTVAMVGLTARIEDLATRLETVSLASPESEPNSDSWQTSLDELVDLTRQLLDRLDQSFTLIRFE